MKYFREETLAVDISGNWGKPTFFVFGCMPLVNSEGFLAEVFHPWVRWEGPGSGFENSSGGGAGGAGGGGVWAQVGGPKLGPRGWAQAGPKWVGPRWAQAGPKLVKNLDFFKHHFFAGF